MAGGELESPHWPFSREEKESGMGKPVTRIVAPHLYLTKKASQIDRASPINTMPAGRGQARAAAQILNCFIPVVDRSQTSKARTGRMMIKAAMRSQGSRFRRRDADGCDRDGRAPR